MRVRRHPLLLLCLATTSLSVAIACDEDGVDPGEDAGTRAMTDAGAPPPPGGDAGAPPPGVDGGGPPPGEDAGPPPPPDGVAMFVAQGESGRTIVSCDDGQTWRADRTLESDGDPLVCGEAQSFRCYDDTTTCRFLNREGSCESRTPCDCDHHPGASKGIAFGAERFVATWGWGPPGSVRHSVDGAAWTTSLEGRTFGGIAYGGGRFVLAGRPPMISSDDGASWTEGAEHGLRDGVWNVRRAGWVDVMGGRFLVAGADGENRDLVLSADGGDSWFRPDPLPNECTAVGGSGGFAAVDGLLVVVANEAYCVSDDGGASFSATPRESGASQVISDGAQAWYWRRGVLVHTEDGSTWTETPTDPPGLRINAVARNPDTGTFVAVNDGWRVWYDEQRFYRSSDGVRWTTLDEAAAARGHDLRWITFGRGEACP